MFVPQGVRLEALHRFTVLWHLTREIQTNRTMSPDRSFDRWVHWSIVHLAQVMGIPIINMYHYVSNFS